VSVCFERKEKYLSIGRENLSYTITGLSWSSKLWR